MKAKYIKVFQEKKQLLSIFYMNFWLIGVFFTINAPYLDFLIQLKY